MINEKMVNLGKQPSVIRELFEFGKRRKEEIGEENVFDFSLGNPSVPAPLVVKKELINLLEKEDPTFLHGYTSAMGDEKAREAIVTYINSKYHCQEKKELVYMTCGAAASLTIALKALCNQDDEVIVFAPFFPEYRIFIENSGGKIVVCGFDKNTFEPDMIELEKLINENTKLLIINSPNNPSGVIYSKECIEKIASLLRSKQKEYNKEIYLLADEPYRELVYNQEEVPYITKYYDNSLVAYSFSKSLSLPGERIGYLLVGNKCFQANSVFYAICGAGRSLGYVCAPSLFQHLIPSVIGKTSNIDDYKENLKELSSLLEEIGYEVVHPQGAFYLFVKALEEDDNEFSKRAREFNLLLVPSTSFGVKGYVRIAYCVSLKQIKNSYNAFKELYMSYL
ncbi:MAG: pyridoxal phosphate-dependent aminotransferase [Bacilli bacterium]|nr:pyridoxal phosphate-dependent aminotransferase [Bacilli bacterium]